MHDWLNSEFFEEAFTPEEKDVMMLSTVTDDNDQAYDTADRVFLLSTWEAEIYFADNAARACSGTPFYTTSIMTNRKNGVIIPARKTISGAKSSRKGRINMATVQCIFSYDSDCCGSTYKKSSVRGSFFVPSYKTERMREIVVHETIRRK